MVKVIATMENLVFGDEGPYAQQLVSDQIGKIVRYTLKPGQELDETHAPFMPRYFMVEKGEGIFKTDDGDEQKVGPGAVVIFPPKEDSTITATDSDLVVIGFLFWATGG